MDPRKRHEATKAEDTLATDEPGSDVFPISSPTSPNSRPTVKPVRPEMPTSPEDLSEYAREHTGPDVGVVSSNEALDFDPTKIPHIVLSHAALVTLQLDHRAGFLISLVDGVSTVEMIVDVAGMAEEDALMALYDLFVRGAIAFR
jgi:hypothetical protein